MNGSSVIRERKPGVWEIRVYTGRTAAGKVQHVSRTVHGGKRKAEDARRALIAEVKAGKHRASKGSVANLLERHLRLLELTGASPSTLRSYRSYVKHNIEPEFGHLAVEDLQPEMLDAFYEKLATRQPRPMAASTIRQHHAIISGALKQAGKWGWLEVNAAKRATPPKVRADEIIAPTVVQILQLVDAAERRNPTLAALLFVAATTGARRGELCAMRWRNVDLDAGRMMISESVVEPGQGEWRIKDTKSHKAGRVALDVATVVALRAHRQRVESEAEAGGMTVAPDAFVFSQTLTGTEPYRPSRVTGFFGRLRDEAGWPKMRLHHTRHFVATQSLAAGADIRTLAGRLRHDPNMTLKVYGHLLEERDRALADHMGELLRPGATVPLVERGRDE